MITSSIRRKIKSIVQKELGNEFKPLPMQGNVDENDDRSLAAGFAVTVGSGIQTYYIANAINMEQTFIVTLTKRAYSRTDDNNLEDSIDALYNSIDGIISRLCKDNMDMRDKVQKVQLTDLPEPRTVGDQRDIAKITLDFKIRFLIA